MITPRPYLSWSQLDQWERSPERYKEVYLYGAKTPDNAGMAFGSKMSEGLENEEATGDPILDLLMARLPKFDIMDQIVTDPKGVWVKHYDHRQKKYIDIRLPFLRNGKEKIPILAKPDTWKLNMTSFKEYKTGQEPWSKSKVDNDEPRHPGGQITFYATAFFLITGKIPHDIELTQVMTAKGANEPLDKELGAYEGLGIRATGEIRRIATKRSTGQIINMMIRMKKAWEAIGKLSEELL